MFQGACNSMLNDPVGRCCKVCVTIKCPSSSLLLDALCSVNYVFFYLFFFFVNVGKQLGLSEG